MNTCGTCTLCCKLVPVAELGVRAFQTCPHERNAPYAKPGCAIYPDRPRSCQVWVCHYLAGEWADDLRPDRCGVVFDTTLDFCRVTDIATGRSQEVPAVQAWVAPGFELAYETDPVRAVALAVLDQGYAVLWRYRGPDGGQLAVSLFKDADGRPAKSAPTAPVEDYNAGESTEDRLWRAMAAHGIEREGNAND